MMVQVDRHNFYPQNSRNASVCNLTFSLALKTGLVFVSRNVGTCELYSILINFYPLSRLELWYYNLKIL